MTERLGECPDWSRLPAAGWPWLQEQRRQAWRLFEAAGLPEPHVEAWKYTRLDDLPARGFMIGRDGVPDEGAQPADTPLGGHLLLFRGGRYCARQSRRMPLPPGVKLLSLHEALTTERPLLQSHLGQIARLDGHPFAALNASRFDDGLLLWLAAGTRMEQPIHCRFEGAPEEAPAAAFPRLLIVLEAGSEALLIEESTGQGEAPHLTDLLCEIRLGEGAKLFHGRLVREGDRAQQFAGIHVEQAPGSRYRTFSLNLGGALCRNDLQVRLGGEGAEAQLDGLYLLGGHQHLDNHLRVDHLAPGGRSDQFYKGILWDHARGVFNGLAVVHPGAQRSDARQINRNLLLSEGAEMDTKPELQIEADDVKCSHGATVGYLDEDALFYLRSRGLSAQLATRLLTFAFARESLQRVPSGTLQEYLQTLIEQALERLPGGSGSP